MRRMTARSNKPHRAYPGGSRAVALREPPKRVAYAAGSKRRGAVLILVLVVVMLLSFAAFSFSELMLAESQASRLSTQSQQARVLAESGIEAAAAFLEDPAARSVEPIVGNTRRFQNVSVTTLDSGVGRFTVRMPARPSNSVTSTAMASKSTSPIRSHTLSQPNEVGLIDESAKLNLNALPLEPHKRRIARKMLTALPAMTDQIADAILDWMDEDDEPSEFGAESSFYSALNPPRWPKQARIESLEELLQVRGVTRELLFGENDSTAAWSDFLTLNSRERNLRRNSSPKLNVNHPDLVELFDSLQAEFNIEVARFIVAWRLAGNTEGVESQRDEPDRDDNSEDAKKSRERMAKTRVKKQLGGFDDDEPAQSKDGALTDAEKSAAKPPILRGGLDLSRKPAYFVRSLWDLIGCNVRIDVDRRETILKSPWPHDPASIDRVLRDITDRLTITHAPVISGRININQASRPVLLSIPGMTESLADAILAAQLKAKNPTDRWRHEQSLAWLLDERLLDLPQLRQLAPYLTTGGDVFRGVSVGHIDGTRIATQIEFIIDASRIPANVLELRER